MLYQIEFCYMILCFICFIPLYYIQYFICHMPYTIQKNTICNLQYTHSVLSTTYYLQHTCMLKQVCISTYININKSTSNIYTNVHLWWCVHLFRHIPLPQPLPPAARWRKEGSYWRKGESFGPGIQGQTGMIGVWLTKLGFFGSMKLSSFYGSIFPKGGGLGE